ncbi:MAG: DUF4055 domain-containing protein [Actinomycetia bacterium]|nr:DUF4055 domain-containing protein [Actinomycetes bacterium]
MPVEDLHPQYENKQYEFRQMRDTISGPSSVKRSGALYLPIPAAMYEVSSQPQTGISYDQNDLKNGQANIISNAPWRHNIPAYSSYLQRSRFPDMTSLLLMGLTGIAIKKKPEIKLPTNIKYMEESATKDGKTLTELFNFCVKEVLSVGRISLLLEIDKKSNKFFINTYSAESFINWKTSSSGMEKSTEVASLAVFQEQCASSDADEFTTSEDSLCQLVLREEGLVPDVNSEDGFSEGLAYNVQRYIDSKPVTDPIFPSIRGKTIPFVPLVTVNSENVGFDVGNCPLIGVSDIAISIYQKDADMSNSEFLTCNPMLVTIGLSDEMDENGNPTGSPSFPVGSNITMNLPDTESDAKYIEPQSNCLQHMITRIQDLKDEAVQYGAAILSTEKNSSEAAETVRLRQSGNSSSLRTVIKQVGEGIEQILQYAYMWDKNSVSESTELEFLPNLELTESRLSSQEITALLQSMMNKGISRESYLMNLREGGIKLSGETTEEEISKIDNQRPMIDEE